MRCSRSVLRLHVPLVLGSLLLVARGESRAAEPRAYDVKLYTLDGRFLSTRDLREREEVELVLVDFFNLSCEPCLKALPDICKLEAAHPGLAVVAVALPLDDVSEAEDKARIAAYFREHGLGCTVVYDLYQKAAERFGVKRGDELVLPAYFLVGEQGRIVAQSNIAKKIMARLRKAE